MTHIIFSYPIYDDHHNKFKNENDLKSDINYPKDVHKTPMFRFKGYNLHQTADYTQWGMVMIDTDKYALVSKRNSQLSGSIEKHQGVNSITLKYLDKKIIEFQESNNLN